MKNQCFILTFLLSRVHYFHSIVIYATSVIICEKVPYLIIMGGTKMVLGVFLFGNGHFNNFHITLETQGWKVQLIFFIRVSTSIS